MMTTATTAGANGRWALELEGVSRRYEGPPEVQALTECTLRIGSGEFVAIMGPSGAGKSTLLNIIGILDRPTSGRYRLLGRDIGTMGETDRTALRARCIGFVFQSFNLMEYRSARENVEAGMLFTHRMRTERRHLAGAALGQVGLTDRSNAAARQLSGGERQRVAIARAVAAGPAVLLADEPTGNLDSETSHRLLETFRTLHLHGLTVVVVTHSPDVAEWADRVVRVSDGHVSE